MSLLIEHRIMSVGMRFIAFRQQHGGAQVNRLSPELREQLALDLDVLHVLRIARRKRRRNFVIQAESDLIAGERVKVKMASISKHVSWRLVELLPFPLVHVRPDGVAVSTLKSCVNVKQPLDVIIARGKFAHRLQGIAQGERVHSGGLSRLQALYIDGQHLGPRTPRAHLQTRLGIIGPGNDYKQPAGDWLRLRCRKRDLKGDAGGGGRNGKAQAEKKTANRKFSAASDRIHVFSGELKESIRWEGNILR